MTYMTTEELYEELSLLLGLYIDLPYTDPRNARIMVHEYYIVNELSRIDGTNTIEIWLKSIETDGDYKMTPREFFHAARVVVRKQEWH
jgi:hypothetical protein